MPFHPEPSAQAPCTRTIFRTRCSWFCAESTPQVNSNKATHRNREIVVTARIGFVQLIICYSFCDAQALVDCYAQLFADTSFVLVSTMATHIRAPTSL